LSTPKKSFLSVGKIGNYCIGDISVDDPQMSPNAGCDNEEVIGNNLILDLKDDLAKLTEDIEKERELNKLVSML
jgi:hypothetical protein